MFYTDRFLFCRNCLFHRNNMHTDPGASGRHHWRYLFKGQSRHIFKKICKLRVLLHLFGIHYHKFGASRYKHGKNILLMAVFILPVIFNKSDHAHFLKQFFRAGNTFFTFFCYLLKPHRNTHFHGKCNLRHFIRNYSGKSPILRIIYSNFNTNPVRNLLSQF